MDSLLSYGLCYKNALKRIVHFQMTVKLPKIVSFFKKLTIFGILRFLPIWIRRERIQSRQFWAILSDFCKKMDLNFFKFSKIAAEMSKIADFEFFSWRIQIGKNLKIPKMVKFLKIKQFLAIWQPFENEQFFSMHFYSITHMKVGNPFIFVKLL